MIGDQPKRFPKVRLSKATLLAVGHALETSAAIHVLNYDDYEIVVGKRGGRRVRRKLAVLRWKPTSKLDPYVNTGHKAVEDALKLLRRALHLPKDFSFTSAEVLRDQRIHNRRYPRRP